MSPALEAVGNIITRGSAPAAQVSIMSVFLQPLRTVDKNDKNSDVNIQVVTLVVRSTVMESLDRTLF